MNPPHVKKMCQNKPWTDKTGQFPHCDCTLEVPCLLYANGFPVPRRDLNLGRPEHIKRTCDGSIPSNARIRFMLGRRPWTAIQKREELSQDPTGCAKIRSALGNEHRENEPPTCEEDVPEQALDRQDGPVPPLRLHLGGTMPPLRKWVPRPPSRS